MEKVRNMIIDELLKLNYNMGSLGTIYLIETIEYLDSKENYLDYLKRLDVSTYPAIAEKLNINVETLKSHIQKATASANCEKNNELIEHLTPKVTISYILEKIKIKEGKYIF